MVILAISIWIPFKNLAEALENTSDPILTRLMEINGPGIIPDSILTHMIRHVKNQ